MSRADLPGLPEAFYQCKGSFGKGVTRYEMPLANVGTIARKLVVLVEVLPGMGLRFTGFMQLPGRASQVRVSREWRDVLKALEEILERG
jgi:hypothetical protein